MISEPTAAIIEYKRTHKDQVNDGDLILVIDCGGGTLDVCLCEIVEDQIIVRQYKGNQHLGGNDLIELSWI